MIHYGRTNERDEEKVAEVQERYGRIAEGKVSGCCGPDTCAEAAATETARAVGYTDEDLGGVPRESVLGLGCGAPIDALDLQPGETVLDLGSGGGLDAFLAAGRVGPTGHVIGVDMTPQMIDRARAAAANAGLAHVEFRSGRLEALPVEDASVDAITSNCVINLVPDKAAVFREAARVLRPGGRLVVSDIVLDGRLPEALERDVLAWVGCVAGAKERRDYFRLLEEVGFVALEVLRDVDYLASVPDALPPGVDPRTVSGRVRSVTYRARRP